nr:phosphoribosyltransferase family protein [uncultured Noviherbaspirillum sp.]
MTTTRLFKDRADAALMLADRIAAYRGAHPLVLAIPRGAVPMAQGIAQALDGELDVVLVRKLGAPFSEEFAVGSVDESGTVHRLPHAGRAGANDAYLEQEAVRQLAVLRRRRERYTPLHPPIDPAGRIVIVVDDGLATGATMIAALTALRARQPAKLICAVPVAAPDSLAQVAALADEVVCLHAPQDFAAVGQFYLRFEQVDDDEVAAILAAAGKN